MAGQSVVGRGVGTGISGAGNNYDGRVNKPKTAFVEIFMQSKFNQPITKMWTERQLRELVVLGSVKNVRQIGKNQIQMTVRSELKDMVRSVIGNSCELLQFYVVPDESVMGGGK
jgi:hypothetical protein